MENEHAHDWIGDADDCEQSAHVYGELGLFFTLVVPPAEAGAQQEQDHCNCPNLNREQHENDEPNDGECHAGCQLLAQRQFGEQMSSEPPIHDVSRSYDHDDGEEVEDGPVKITGEINPVGYTVHDVQHQQRDKQQPLTPAASSYKPFHCRELLMLFRS